MAGGIDWFRWHHGSVNDPKFQLVARRAGASVAEVVAVWATLLESASMHETRGYAGEQDFEAIDCALGLTEGRSQAIYDAMQTRDLLDADGHIVRWDRRQPKRERGDEPSSTERVKAFRERKRDETPGNATADNATPAATTNGTETPRGEERREEKVKRATRLPTDWTPSPEDLAYAQKAGLLNGRVALEAEKFRDWWAASPGQKGVKADWPATWRTWVRKAIEAPGAKAPDIFRERGL